MKILPPTFCVCIIIYLSFHNGSPLNVYDNISLGSSYHCHYKSSKTGYNKSLLYAAECVCMSPCMCVYTSGRHADFAVDAIWITAELLQAVDGALTHYRFPTEGSVVDDLQHNGRGVHLLFGKKLSEKTIEQAM